VSCVPVTPICFDMGGGFRPFRRNVSWAQANEVEIRPLLDALEFTAGNKNWGYQLRFGLFSISERDFDTIAKAMTTESLTGGGISPSPTR